MNLIFILSLFSSCIIAVTAVSLKNDYLKLAFDDFTNNLIGLYNSNTGQVLYDCDGNNNHNDNPIPLWEVVFVYKDGSTTINTLTADHQASYIINNNSDNDDNNSLDLIWNSIKINSPINENDFNNNNIYGIANLTIHIEYNKEQPWLTDWSYTIGIVEVQQAVSVWEVSINVGSSFDNHNTGM